MFAPLDTTAAKAALEALESRRRSSYAERADKDLPTYKADPGADWRRWLAVCTTAEQRDAVMGAVHYVIRAARETIARITEQDRARAARLTAEGVAFEQRRQDALADARGRHANAGPEEDGLHDRRGSLADWEYRAVRALGSAPIPAETDALIEERATNALAAIAAFEASL